jgi:hypothetical protein
MLCSRAHRCRNTEHAKTAASDGSHLREFEDDNPGICLRGDGFQQLRAGFFLVNFARAANDRELT